MLKVFKCGQKVRTTIGDVIALITSIKITNETVVYEISYFNKGEYKNVWVLPEEIFVYGAEKKEIGFKTK